jgi:hypothetical protein
MVVLEEKLGGGLVDRSAGILGIVSRALFLGRCRVYPTLLGQSERLPRTGTARGNRMCGIHGPAQEAYVSCVSGFPYMVYINLNRSDSRI